MGCYSSSWHPRSLIIILIDMMYGCIGVNSGRKTVEVFHVHKVHPTIYFTIFLLIWNSFMIMMTFKLRSNRNILHFQSVCMLICPISQLVHCANIALRRTFWTTKLCKVIFLSFLLAARDIEYILDWNLGLFGGLPSNVFAFSARLYLEISISLNSLENLYLWFMGKLSAEKFIK